MKSQLLEVQAQTTGELLATILGGKNAYDQLQKLNTDPNWARSVAGMACAEDVAAYYGVSATAAKKLVAAAELGRRMYGELHGDLPAVHCPEDAASYMMPFLRYRSHEYFYVLLLNSKGKIIGARRISEGSLNASVVHPREAYEPAIVAHAAAIIGVHNHPSGDPTPSKEDRSLTKALFDAGKILGIPFVDHIIIGDGIYYSFKEHGLC